MIFECEICGRRSKNVTFIKKCEKTKTAIRILRGHIFRVGNSGKYIDVDYTAVHTTGDKILACLGYRTLGHSIEVRCLIALENSIELCYFNYTNTTKIHIADSRSNEYKRLQDYLIDRSIIKSGPLITSIA